MWDLGLVSGPKKGLEWENWRNWTSLNSDSSDRGSVVINVLGLCKTLTMQEREWGPGGCSLGCLVEFSCKPKLASKKTFIRKESAGHSKAFWMLLGFVCDKSLGPCGPHAQHCDWFRVDSN